MYIVRCDICNLMLIWYIFVCSLVLFMFCFFVSFVCFYFFFFFFSSRRRHTRLTCDWSSDVCSSDLIWVTRSDLLVSLNVGCYSEAEGGVKEATAWGDMLADTIKHIAKAISLRSEERRVGKECRSRGWRCQ